MGVTLYYRYYPKECNHKNVLPYLNSDICEDINGKLGEEFYKLCNEYGNWNEKAQCWVFSNKTKLFQFCADQSVPATISDYVVDPYDWLDDEEEFKEDDIFIIWKR